MNNKADLDQAIDQINDLKYIDQSSFYALIRLIERIIEIASREDAKGDAWAYRSDLETIKDNIGKRRASSSAVFGNHKTATLSKLSGIRIE